MMRGDTQCSLGHHSRPLETTGTSSMFFILDTTSLELGDLKQVT